jgi:hypothetical protein
MAQIRDRSVQWWDRERDLHQARDAAAAFVARVRFEVADDR